MTDTSDENLGYHGPKARDRVEISMVERVARAIFFVSDCDEALAEKAARAAIAAMREPTEAMIKAMQDSNVFDEVNNMISFCHARGSHPGGLQGPPPMPAAYTIMIDAALNEDK